jgi:integrase
MAEADIAVVVVKYPDRKNLMMRYTDPRSGKQVARSAGSNVRRQAERAAAKWEAELREGRYQKLVHISWQDFRERYERHVDQEHADKTLLKVISVLNAVEQLEDPRRLCDLDDQRLIAFKQKLQTTCSPSTVGSYLAHLRSALSTAVEWGMLPRLPKMPKVRRAKGAKLMRGRAVADSEFKRMLEATCAVVGDDAAASWQFLLRGFWTSGLRLQDACQLHWSADKGHSVDFSGKRPMFVIRGLLEKGKRDRLLPMAPEFVQLLEEVPPDARQGRVFKPQAKRPGGPMPQQHRIGETIAAIGQAADVIVDTDPLTGEPTKYASAHDLRRAFGHRWAKRVMPAVLQKLMRHASIQTTMQYYVSLEAEDTADVLWRALGNTLGNSG